MTEKLAADSISGAGGSRNRDARPRRRALRLSFAFRSPPEGIDTPSALCENNRDVPTVGGCHQRRRDHLQAEVAELADAHGSGPCTRKGVGVQIPSSAPLIFG